MNKIQTQGTCPICGQDELNYKDTKNEGTSIGYVWQCANCKTNGIEWYELKFVQHITEE